MKKYKLFIFDLDGVIFDTKFNMRASWNAVKKKHNIKSSFKNYFSLIGAPFEKILEKLNITHNIKEISETYSKTSKKKISSVKIYPGVKNTLKILGKNNKIAVVTSKDAKRTKIFLNKFNLKFDYISCPKKTMKGKPYPDQIFKVLKKIPTKRKDSVYVGDMLVDLETAKNAKIDFIMTKYGYSPKDVKISNKILKIKSFKEIKNYQN